MSPSAPLTAPPRASSPNVDVFLYVQHLLGIGHLRRAAALARALERAGLHVLFATGGRPVTHLDVGGATVLQLPPLHAADESFKVLHDEADQPVDEAWKAARAEKLHRTFEESQAKVLVMEMFPFGRRQMRFELDPLVAAAKARGVPVISSVRDILTTHKTPGKSEWIVERVKRDIDHVLVHGDQDFFPLEESFPPAREIADKLHYTGYVLDLLPPPDPFPERRGVLISTGGGAVAAPLAEAALKARALTSLQDEPWRLLLGDNLPGADFERFKAQAPAGFTVERNRPDFPQLLYGCRLSISQAGYNTVLETLATGTPAVVVPFAASGESEQTARAERLSTSGSLTMLAERDLTPERLAQAIEKTVAMPPSRVTLDFQGAEESARFIRSLIAAHD